MEKENHKLSHREYIVSLKEKEKLSTTVLRLLHNTTMTEAKDVEVLGDIESPNFCTE